MSVSRTDDENNAVAAEEFEPATEELEGGMEETEVSMAEELPEDTLVPNVPDSLQDNGPEWDGERVKRLVVALQKKHEASLADWTEENRVLKGQQELLKQMLEQSHREGEKLRGELDKAHQQLNKHDEGVASLEELEELKVEIARLQVAARSAQRDQKLAEELMAEERQNNELHKVRLEKLGVAIKERDKRIADLHHFEHSYRKAYEHKQQVESQLEHEANVQHTLKIQKDRLTQELAGRNSHIADLQAELERLQQYQADHEQQRLTLHKQREELRLALAAQQQQLDSEQRRAAVLEQRAIDAKQQQTTAQEELLAFQEQFKQLKARTITAQQDLKAKDTALLETHQIIEQLKYENQQLQKALQAEGIRLQTLHSQLTDSQAAAEGWQRQYEELTTKEQKLARDNIGLITALEDTQKRLLTTEKALETLQIESRQAFEQQATEHQLQHEQQQQHTDILQAALQDYEEQLREQNERLAAEQACSQELSRQLEDLDLRCQATTEQLHIALQAIQALEGREEQYTAAIASREEDLVASQEALASQHEANVQIHEALKASEEQNQDKEASLKLAQHHLAKKVKDYGLLEEKHNELQQTLRKTEGHIEELNKKLEEQRQSMRQQEEQHLDTKRLADTHIRDWENKYFEKDKDWQQSEKRCQQEREQVLEVEKKLERCMQRLQKFMHLEMMLRDFGLGSAQSMMEATPPSAIDTPISPAPAPASTALPTAPPTAPLNLPSVESPLAPLPPQESLFENALAASKHKAHLFD